MTIAHPVEREIARLAAADVLARGPLARQHALALARLETAVRLARAERARLARLTGEIEARIEALRG
jgi:hypothetical protein